VQATALRLLRSLADQDGLAVLLITHDQAAADALAEQVVTLPPAGLS
jgi:ABC-type dipeptide/oligopeptide/nickel transport system ATPase component